jgi:D-alanine-D-alanine ligase-like ATP-grasp enzyme
MTKTKRGTEMRVCILSDEHISDFNPAPYVKDFDWQMTTMTAPVLDKIRALAEKDEFDVFLNICEGYEFEDEEDDQLGYHAIDVVRALELLDLPFTGADSNCFDPTREEMQAIADANQISFVKGYQVKSVAEAEKLVAKLRYPIMVKHPKSYGSTGMTKDSRADTLEEVRTQVARICGEFGAARMEEFIVGKEFNVLVVDNADDLGQPFAYPPAELVFPPNEEFWHVDVKWNYDAPFDFKQVTDAELIARLHDLARRMFLAMGVAGYGRCDIRMNAAGQLFILEINPNGGIMFKPEEYGPADYMILYDRDGYKGFFDRIFASAQLRRKLRVKK